MHVADAINARKSIRKYLPDTVEEEKLLKVLEAGRLAPSASNGQKWKFIAVREEETRMRLAKACCSQLWVAQAPVILVLCAYEQRDMPCGQSARTVDCSIALSFMMLQAQELGLSTCWLGAFSNNDVKTLLSIPADADVIAVAPLGYAAEEGRPRVRKSAEEVFCFERWESQGRVRL